MTFFSYFSFFRSALLNLGVSEVVLGVASVEVVFAAGVLSAALTGGGGELETGVVAGEPKVRALAPSGAKLGEPLFLGAGTAPRLGFVKV